MKKIIIPLFMISFCLLSACAGPEPGQPHPFDPYMNPNSGISLPRTDTTPGCADYGCQKQ